MCSRHIRTALWLIAIAGMSGELRAQAPSNRKLEPELRVPETLRSGRIARVPFRAGALSDHWSVAGAISGFADVYEDSVVVFASTLALRASDPVTDTVTSLVDSVAVGLAAGERGWSIVRRSPAVVVETPLRRGGMWAKQNLRFVIPVDSEAGFDLAKSWLVLEVMLSAPRTSDNPNGMAWTYAHAARLGLKARM